MNPSVDRAPQLLPATQQTSAPVQPAGTNVAPDLIITDAKVYTVNAVQPWAEAFAVRDGLLITVGSSAV